jgi:hypothetical protein
VRLKNQSRLGVTKDEPKVAETRNLVVAGGGSPSSTFVADKTELCSAFNEIMVTRGLQNLGRKTSAANLSFSTLLFIRDHDSGGGRLLRRDTRTERIGIVTDQCVDGGARSFAHR